MSATPKYAIQTGWQFTALFAVLMLLAVSLIAWLPLALYRTGILAALPFKTHTSPLMYALWVIPVYLGGLFCLIAFKVKPDIYFDEKGFQIEYGYFMAGHDVFIPAEHIAHIYLAHKKIEILCIETKTGQSHLFGFVRCDTRIQQQLVRYFANLFVNLKGESPQKETFPLL